MDINSITIRIMGNPERVLSYTAFVENTDKDGKRWSLPPINIDDVDCKYEALKRLIDSGVVKKRGMTNGSNNQTKE